MSTRSNPAKKTKKIVSSTKRKPVISSKKSSSKLFSHNAKMYKIIWRDAFSEMDEWHDCESIDREDYLCETVGFLIENNGKNQYYTIASTMTQDNFFCCVINIPKAMVISKKRINLTTK